MPPVRTIAVLGDRVDILVSGAMTEGQSLTIVQTTPPGGGPPTHQHTNEDETFYILEGEFEILKDGVWHKALPGDAFHGPRGSVHTFRNSGTRDGKLLVHAMPAGFESFLEEISPLKVPDDLPKLFEIAGRYGITFPPPA